MTLTYPHNPTWYIKTNMRLYRMVTRGVYYRYIIMMGLSAFVLAVEIAKRETNTDRAFGYIIGIGVGSYALLSLINRIGYDVLMKKKIKKRLEDLVNATVTYEFQTDALYYKEPLMETKTDWKMFKGFFMLDDALVIYPAMDGHLVYLINSSAVPTEDFQKVLGFLKEKLPELNSSNFYRRVK